MSKSILGYDEAETFDQEILFYDFEMAGYGVETCMMCSSPIQGTDGRFGNLFNCTECGWWVLVVGGGGFGAKDCKVYRGLLKRYDVESIDVPLQQLRAFLRRHPHDVAHVNPTAFERLVGDCLRDALHPCEVVHVGGTGDGGVDLLLLRADSTRHVVQVKRRADLLSSEGVRVVRELNGVLFREGLSKGMVVSTAARFTPAARREANIKTLTGEPYEMRLLSLPDVVDLFNVTPQEPYEPWRQFAGGAARKPAQ